MSHTKPDTHPNYRWTPTDQTGYTPIEWIRLGQALANLHNAAHPNTSTWPTGTNHTTNPDSGQGPDPNPNRQHARNALKRHLATIHRLTRQITQDTTWDPTDPHWHNQQATHYAWQCTCGHRARFGARYCDRCGTPQPDPATKETR